MNSDSSASNLTAVLGGETCQVADDVPAAGIFAAIEPKTRLGQIKTWHDDAVCRALHAELFAFNLGDIYSDVAFDFEADAVGICHPYGLAAPVRRALPALVDADPIQSAARTEADALRNRAEDSPAISAVETPFAALLAMIGKQVLELSATLVVLAVGGRGFEITTVQASRQGNTLVMDAVSHFEVSDPSSFENVAQDAADHVLKSASLYRTPVTLAVVEPGQATLVGKLEAALGHPRIKRIDELDLAAGAAVYSTICSAEPNPIGILKIKSNNVAPHSLGIVGLGEHDRKFWCPIIEFNRSINESSQIKLDQSGISRLLLAECTDRNRTPNTWISDSQHTPSIDDLRWHTMMAVESSLTTNPTHLLVELAGSTGLTDYAWSDPFVNLSLISRSRAGDSSEIA